jgi:hypothetical protein
MENSAMLGRTTADSGKWICGSGAEKNIPLIAAVMRGAFVSKRFGDRGAEYEWWMSCDNFHGLVARPIKPKKIDDFSSDFLADVSKLMSQSGRDTLISLGEARVYVDILQKSPGSAAIFSDAISLIDRWGEWQKTVFRSLITSIIPIYSTFDGAERGVGFTDHNFMGAVFVSVERQSPYPDIALNISLAHELGHLAMMLYQFSENLLYETKEWVYSGVRKVERPALMSLHASVALSYMIASARSLLSESNPHSRNAYIQALIDEYESSLRAGLSALGHLEKTYLCEQIINDLTTQLQD